MRSAVRDAYAVSVCLRHDASAAKDARQEAAARRVERRAAVARRSIRVSVANMRARCVRSAQQPRCGALREAAAAPPRVRICCAVTRGYDAKAAICYAECCRDMRVTRGQQAMRHAGDAWFSACAKAAGLHALYTRRARLSRRRVVRRKMRVAAMRAYITTARVDDTTLRART